MREISHGEAFTVLSRGKPVAIIAPVNVAAISREAAKQSLHDRLHQQKSMGERKWTRDELYDEES